MDKDEPQAAASDTPLINLKKLKCVKSNRSPFYILFNQIKSYLKAYDKVMYRVVFSTNCRVPKARPKMAVVKAPVMKRRFGPILSPNLPKMGAKKKAAMLQIPKTNPY